MEVTDEHERVPFEPIGELARWRTIAALLGDTERGTTVSFETLADALDLDPVEDRRAIAAAVRQAIPTLLSDHARTVVAARGVGYRVVLPDEHLEIAGRHQKRATRSVARAKNAVEHVDLSELSEAQRHVVRLAAQALGHQQRAIRRLDVRQRDLEKALNSVRTRVERSEEETQRRLDEMSARIRELEGGRE